MPSPTSTVWTGNAGNGLWSDPNNWSNGVPPAGASFASSDQDVATIDNSIETTPFTVTIDGSEGGASLTIDAADPTGGVAVLLTGTLNLFTNQSPSGAYFGVLNLVQGTFEIDGGTLEGAEAKEEGGTVTFAAGVTSTLSGSFIDGAVTIGAGEVVAIDPTSFAVFDGTGGFGTATTVSITGGGQLQQTGGLYLDGTIDITDGSVAIGSGINSWGGTAILFADGGSLTMTNNSTFNGVEIEGSLDFTSNWTLNIQNGTTVFGSSALSSPTVIDLDGGTIDVTSTLSLVNAIVENGTIILESGSGFSEDAASSLSNVTITDNRPTDQTNWTGAAGDGSWSDAGNWTNGVPLAGTNLTSYPQSVAVISNGFETSPFTVTITGAQAAQEIILNTQDPSGGVSVSLQGTLDTSWDGEGGSFGSLDLQSGTFEVDGGSISYTGIQMDGGNLSFGDQSVWGQATFYTDLFNGDFTIGNNGLAVLAGFDVFHGNAANGFGTSTVTINGGSDLIDSGTLADNGTIDVQGLLALSSVNGSNLQGYGGGTANIFIDGGTLAVDQNATLSNDVTIYGGYAVLQPGVTLTIDNTSTTDIGQTGANETVLNLDGGTLDVFGTLNLTNTYVENGTISIEAGATYTPDGTDSFSNVTVSGGIPPFVTNWTGNGDGTSWTDPNNWDNGVPPSGAPYSSGGDDVANIDNTFGNTIVISGDQTGANVVLDAADPAGGPAVSLQGTLNLAFDASTNGAYLGFLDLQQGTFEVDGGTLQVLTAQEDGGQITFGSAAVYGASTLNAAGITGDFTIGNGSDLVIAAYSFGAFNQSVNNTVGTDTIDDGSELDVKGSFSTGNNIDIQSGEVLFDGGDFNNAPGAAVIEDGGTISFVGTTTFQSATLDGDLTIGDGAAITVSSGSTLVFDKSGGTTPVSITLDGSIDDSGTLDIKGSASGSGSITLEDGSVLEDDAITVASIAVNGNATLNGVALDTALTVNGGILTVAGTDTFGNAADASPMQVDLGGGTLDITGTLNLVNTVISDGTVIVESGGDLIADATSSLNRATLEHVQADGSLLISGQDVLLASTQTLDRDNLEIGTGELADGAASGTPGELSFDDTINSVSGGLTGDGTVTVTDANGPSKAVLAAATLSATVPGRALLLEASSYNPDFGNYSADNGSTLEIGASVSADSALAGGVFDGTISATGSGTVQFDGAPSGITTVNGTVTLDPGSQILAVTPSGALSLQQTLTSIGSQNPTTYLDSLGILNLDGGASFTDPNAVFLYGTVNLTGGTFSAAALGGSEVIFNYGFGTIYASGVKGYGAVDADISDADESMFIEASGGTLTYNGTLFDHTAYHGVSFIADANSTLTINSTIDSENDNDYLGVELNTGSRINLTAPVVDAGDVYINFEGSNATLALTPEAGTAFNVYLSAGGTGNAIDLAGVTALTDAAGDPDVQFYSGANGVEQVIVTPSTTPGQRITFNISDYNPAVGLSFVNSDGDGGSLIEFAAGPNAAQALVEPGPDMTVDANGVYHLDKAFHVGDTATTAAIVISNSAASNPDQGTLSGTYLSQLSEGITETGSFTGLVPGASTAQLGGATDVGSGTPISFTVQTNGPGLVEASGTLQLGSSSNEAGNVEADLLPTQKITVEASVYRLAGDQFSATSPILHVGQSGQFFLSVTNNDPTDGYSEKLLATVTGSTGGVTAASGSTELGAGGSDGLSLQGSVDTTSAGIVNGTVEVALVSDGTNLDGLGQTSLGTADVAVEATVDNYAALNLVDQNGVGALSYDAATGTYTLDLGTVTEGSNALTADIAAANGASGPADLLSGSFATPTGAAAAFANGASGTFTGLGAGQSSLAEAISLSTINAGSFSESFQINAAGANASGYSGALPTQTLVVTGTVQYEPAPDLVVSSVAAPSQAIAGQIVPVTWTLTNQGDAAATGPWSDNVYLASDAAGDDPQLVGTFVYDGTLAVGASVTRTEQITVPTSITGSEYFVVETDPTDQLLEHGGTVNNTTVASSPTAVAPQPLPELVVSSITPPTTAFSGQQAQVSWTVTNDGTAGTSASAWHDNVYLSLDPTLDASNLFHLGTDTDPLLATVSNPTYLAPGESYTSSATITLPQGISGPYYIIVETDAGDQVYEGSSRGTTNLTTSSVVPVQLTPPPDLQVTQVLAPPSAFSGQPTTVSWIVTNTGNGPTATSAWTDQIWVSYDGAFDGSAILLGTVAHQGALAPGGSYEASSKVDLPIGQSGNATFFVVTDYLDQVYEGALHQNDTGSNPTPTTVYLTPPPDLVSAVGAVPTTVVAGHAVTFTYQVTNDGSTATPNGSWQDSIYLSTTRSLTGAQLLESITHFGALDVDGSYAVTTTVIVPNGLSGTYYLLAQADSGSQVFEVNHADGLSASGPITIVNQPPDLVVSSVAAPTQGVGGHEIAVTWTVTNAGTGDTQGTGWYDEIVLSQAGSDAQTVLGVVAAPQGDLAAGASYTQTGLFELPETLAGNYSLSVRTDYFDSVPEADFNNNTSSGSQISISETLADLQVASLATPVTGTAGDQVAVNWTVQNAGTGTTDANYWYDDVYLSTTPSAAGAVALLGQVLHVNALDAGGSYSASGNFVLPSNLTTGSYYFVVVADAGNQVTEASYADDFRASSPVQLNAATTGPGGVSGPGGATTVPPPDLAVSAVSVPGSAYSGQSIDVSYTLSNYGGATPTGWYDAVYLSRNQTLGSDSDIFLGYINQSFLPGNASTSVNQSFAIPDGLSGPYWVIVSADAGDALTDSNRANNVAASSELDIGLPPVADFAVASITVPANATLGTPTAIQYTVTNDSANAEPGTWEDALYLSADGTWNASDPLIGEVQHTGGVAADGSYSGTLDATLPGVDPGNYYVVVRTDVSAESIGTNATGVSSSAIAVGVPALTLGTPATGTLATGQVAYYQITVAAGQTLSLSLGTDTGASINNIYVRYGALPTTGVFDASSGPQSSADPSAVIQASRPGTYYVMVTGNSVAGTENYTLNATAVPFSVSKITPDYGSNLGSVTLTVNGAQFTAGETVEVVAPDGTVRKADKLDFVSSTEVWATFNLEGLATGAYDVVVVDGSQTSTLAHSFTVNDGPAGQANVTLELPQFLRSGENGIVTVDYANTGDTDIAAPIIDLSTAQALFNENGISTGSSDIEFLGTNGSGPAGILQPGAEGSASFSFTPVNPTPHEIIGFTASYGASTGTTIDWASLENAIKPVTVDTADWNNIFTQFVDLVGTTSASVQAALANEATELGQIGQSTNDISTLLGFELLQASGGLIGKDLVSAVDFDGGGSLLGLVLERNYSAALSGRNAGGLFGDGWVSTYEVKALTDSSGNVYITSDNGVHAFLRQADGTYIAQNGDPATLTQSNGLYQMQDGGFVEQFLANGSLGSVTDAAGNVTNLAYSSSGALQKITDQSTGETLTFTSNAEGHITSATDSNGTVITYSYDPTGNLLESVNGPSGVTRYSYVAATGSAADNALTSMTNPDGTSQSYTYNTQGLLASISANNGTGLTSFSYDGNGRVLVTDALGHQTNVLFDANGDIAQVQDANGNTTALTNSATGSLLSVLTAGNSTASFRYNSSGYVSGETDGLGGTVKVSYANGTQEITSITNQLGAVTQYTYNSAQQVTGIEYEDGSGNTYQYNSLGLVSSKTDADGNTTSYTYDNAGDLLKETFSDGTSDSYTYDAHGNILTATAQDGGISSYTYNSANQLTSVTNAAGQVETYTYNAKGQLASVTEPGGSATDYTYNSAGQLVTVTDGSGNLIDKYTYDSAGQLIETNTGNGSSTTYLYDAIGDTTQILSRNADGSVASREVYTYNSNYQVATETTQDGTWTYGYDAAGDLTNAVFQSINSNIQNQNISYTYDAAGNRISQTVNGVSTSYTTNGMNQYSAVGGTTYTYDADGNVTSETSSAGTTNFKYNAADQLVSETGPTGTTTYQYDALGDLIGQTVNGVQSSYVINPLAQTSPTTGGLSSIAQIDNASGATVGNYVYGDGLAAVSNGTGTSYFNTDLVGNVIGVSGSNGSLAGSYDYLPFGGVLASTGNVNNPFQFEGAFGALSLGNGEYSLRARTYDATTGRFTSPDPSDISGGDNLYLYADNQPTDAVDPTGLWGWGVSASAVAEGGGGVSGAGVNASTSAGSFFDETTNQASDGVLSSQGAFAGTTVPVTGQTNVASYGDPNNQHTNGVIGGTAGVGVGPWLSNARSAEDLAHNTSQTFSLNLPFGSFQFSWGYRPDGSLVWQGSVSVGPSIGASVSIYPTNTDVDSSTFNPNKPTIPYYQTKNQTEYITPHDPNDIVGPAGFGPENFVSASTPLAYTIDFENAATATAPAQDVTITQQLDPNLDWRTFRLTGFNFDNLHYTLSGSQAFYSTVIDLSATKGYDVDVTAGVNVATGLVTWNFDTIDPTTGQKPLDPTVGFLPVDDANNDGLGSVSYTVDPKSGLASGSVVDAQATVVFDDQGPINTAAISNTLDTIAPTSHVAALPTQTNDPTFEVSWSGTDDSTGSGIASYTIFVSEDGGPATVFLANTTQTNALFTGQLGHSYTFSSIATDNAGNVEAPHATPDAAILVGQVLAQAELDTPSPISFGAVREGTTATQTLSIANGSAAPAEGLDVSIGGTTGDATGTGSITLLGGGVTDGKSISVGLGTGAAGAQSGTVTLDFSSDGTGIDGNGQTPLAPQTVTVTGSVFREASFSVGTLPATRIVHVGDTVSDSVAVGNTAAADGYSERLQATVASATGGATVTGPAGEIAAGSSGSLLVAVATTASGLVNETIDLGLASDGTGLDGAGPSTIGSATLSETVQIDNHAQAAVAKSGAGTLTQTDATHYTLNLGSVAEGAAAVTADLSVLNAASGPYADLLAASFAAATGETADFTDALTGVSGVAFGTGAASGTVSLDTGTAGSFTETLTLNPTGSNSSGFSESLAPITITVTGTVTAPTGAQTYTLTSRADTVNGGPGNDTIIATNGTLSAGDQINGGGGVNTLVLKGTGTFDLTKPTTLANIQLVQADEIGQTIDLRAGTSLTLSATTDGKNIIVNGAANTDTIDLGAGNDTVTLGGTGETVVGGGGNDTFNVTSATIGAAIDGGTGASTLVVSGGGSVAMGASITRISTVRLTGATAYDFTAGAIAGLKILDLSTANDTVAIGDPTQSFTGGTGADTVVLTAASAGALVRPGKGGATIEIAGGGTAVLNNSDANVAVKLDQATNLTLGTGGNFSVLGSSGDDTITLTANNLSATSTIDGGGGSNTLVLTGVGRFDFTRPAAFANIQTVEASEVGEQIVLRAGTSLTLDLTSGAKNVTIVGAANNDAIHLGAGNDTVTLGGAGESVIGGGGNDTFNVTATTIGAAIDGGTGTGTLVASGGGSVTMGSNIKDIAGVRLTGTSGYDFTANGLASLRITDQTTAAADTVTVGAASQSVYGGAAALTVDLDAATAGALVHAGTGGATIELEGGGTATLNAGDSNLKVDLAQATVLTLGTGVGLTVEGSSGADTITANGRNQILTGNGGADRLVGANAGYDIFRDTTANLALDTIGNFIKTNDQIDLTDMVGGRVVSFAENAGGTQGVLTVADGFGHMAAITLLGQFAAAGFHAGTDAAGSGTAITYTPPPHTTAALLSPAA